MIFDPDNPDHANILALRTSNAERIGAIQQRGIPFQVNGREAAVLELLLDTLLGESPERLAFESSQAQDIASLLDQFEEQIRTAQLTQGVAMDPRVLQQLAEKNGNGPLRLA